ncbi:Gag/polymerase/env Polyprotein [Phytophthora cinnamomi]|uniref:Gag/polymerase/env Polyprotein n=1 Tax=Phytophthora cinnamomi TaxID=4785 RepID=UPI00355ACCD8|nr:Gag/polymerase/env Polyprotein [Phytophthora cinnamomi]
MIDRAAANGMPPEHLSTLREILDTYPDVWHTVPYRSPPRKYAPLQAQFIREYVQTSVDNGLVEQNNASRSASDVVPVRKPGTQDQFRLTIDCRSVNGMTVPIAGTMPSVATTTDGFQNKKVFGRVDFTQGFWQLPLDEASRAIFTFITPDGVFTPCRVPQGAMDSTLHFQSQVQTKLAPLIPHSALVWVYDVILFAPTVQEFLMTLRAFFEIVKLNMAKSSLIELECLCDIQVAQQAASRELSRLQTTSVEVDGVVMINYRMRIPGNAKDLLARIFVVAHCGSQGHRGQEPMLLAPKERFYITKLEDKVAKFVRQCLLCKHFKGPRQIPRPYGPLLQANERNEPISQLRRLHFGRFKYEVHASCL